ncbi:MAG: heparinase II/III-family protein, partial [Acidimicrobiales bacterium]|nr:heparinase II/III-family protein [Acidimicrobiales bacterium]
PSPEQLPLDRLFAGIDVVSLRGDWSGAASWVGFKGGDAGYNHNQLDLGSFVFEAEGERWALDLGKDDYNLPGYFQSWPGGARWAYYRNRAEGHNTLVIDPDACEDQDARALATITRFQSSSTDAFAIADLTNAYRGRSVRRGVWLKNRTTLVVQDEIAADPTDAARGGADVWWFMHTRASIDVSSDGRSALLTQDGQLIRARVVAPVGARFSVWEATPLPTSPHPELQGSNSGVRKLTLHLSLTEPTTIVVVLEPDETLDPVDPDPRSLGNWQLDDAITTVERQAAVTAPSPDVCHATASPSPMATTIPDTVPVLGKPRFTG